MNRKPDVEAIFEFNNAKTHPVENGYRPAHLLRYSDNGYLTTGEHFYYNTEKVYPGERVSGTITFISPELYPHCMRVGEIISIQEANKVVGYAYITRIFNPILEERV